MKKRLKAEKGIILDENFPRPDCPKCGTECRAIVMKTDEFLRGAKMTYEELEAAIAEGNEERLKWFIKYMDFDHREVAIFICFKCIAVVYEGAKERIT